jgi:adenosylhomocysteine nucleosidase
MRIGIMGAMQEEVDKITSQVNGRRETRGRREYVIGQLYGKEIVAVFSRWGKVAAASTATTLLERYQVDLLVFVGVAGALEPSLHVGDIVIGDHFIQHDMDASAVPGIQRFEIPLLGMREIPAPPEWVAKAALAADQYLANDFADSIPDAIRKDFHLGAPQCRCGWIASGDAFVASEQATLALRTAIPNALCVEMEGAAVAQVAFEQARPFVVMRTISDKADHSAPIDFPRFLASVAAQYTAGFMRRFLESI